MEYKKFAGFEEAVKRQALENPYLTAISPEVRATTSSPPLTLRLVGLPAKKVLRVKIRTNSETSSHEYLDLDVEEL